MRILGLGPSHRDTGITLSTGLVPVRRYFRLLLFFASFSASDVAHLAHSRERRRSTSRRLSRPSHKRDDPWPARSGTRRGCVSHRAFVWPSLAKAMRSASMLKNPDRYYGKSLPSAFVKNLTTENLQYLTINNSLADMVSFAQNLPLPFDIDWPSRETRAVRAPCKALSTGLTY